MSDTSDPAPAPKRPNLLSPVYVYPPRVTEPVLGPHVSVYARHLSAAEAAFRAHYAPWVNRLQFANVAFQLLRCRVIVDHLWAVLFTLDDQPALTHALAMTRLTDTEAIQLVTCIVASSRGPDGNRNEVIRTRTVVKTALASFLLALHQYLRCRIPSEDIASYKHLEPLAWRIGAVPIELALVATKDA